MNIADQLYQTPAWASSRAIVLFLRHGEREAVASHEFPRHDAPLTHDGRRAARALGQQFGSRLGSIRSSPVPRCIETAQHLLSGSGIECDVGEDRQLGDPSVFVTDGRLAMESLNGLGFHQAARRLGEGEALPGFADPDHAAGQFVSLAESLLTVQAVVHVLVTHDLMLSTFVARITGQPLPELEWPGYLHGVMLWREQEGLCLRYGVRELLVPERLRQNGRNLGP